MFDKLEDLRIRLDEILNELQEPDVANDQNRFRKLMKEQNDLTPIVEAYNEYKECKQAIEDSLEMLEEESDEEMRELAKEELNDNKKRVEELEQELKILLLPKDPNDEKNVIVEIRAGAGGDEAVTFQLGKCSSDIFCGRTKAGAVICSAQVVIDCLRCTDNCDVRDTFIVQIFGKFIYGIHGIITTDVDKAVDIVFAQNRDEGLVFICAYSWIF